MIIPTIMCGGAGTRLWPASRDSLPKHLLALFDGLSTFQMTVLRFKDEPGFGRPVIVTAADAHDQVAAQLKAIGAEAFFILEPSRQDSAAAVAAATVHAMAATPDASCLVLAADHRIRDAAAFRDACRVADAGAAEGFIMTLGITPTSPATGYGYIQPGDEIAPKCRRIVRFREKPDSRTAVGYIASGYVWNSGNFLFRPDAMAQAFRKLAPDIFETVEAAYGAGASEGAMIRLDATSFARARKTSVDFAIMEKAAAAGVTPCDAGWSDIGTWDSLWQAFDHDADGNAVGGDVVLHDAKDSIIQADGVLVAALGVRDLAVIASRDAVLVTPRGVSGDVKIIVEALKKAGRSEATAHARILEHWGWIETIVSAAGFDVRRLHVAAGAGLPTRKAAKAGRWIVLSGLGKAVVDGTAQMLASNGTVEIAAGAECHLDNGGEAPLDVIEITFG